MLKDAGDNEDKIIASYSGILTSGLTVPKQCNVFSMTLNAALIWMTILRKKVIYDT